MTTQVILKKRFQCIKEDILILLNVGLNFLSQERLGIVRTQVENDELQA